MNVTLSIDDEILARAREVASRQGTSVDKMIRDYLEGLASDLSPHAGGPRSVFRIVPNSSPLLPGVDPRGFNQLADELEDEAVLSREPRKA